MAPARALREILKRHSLMTARRPILEAADLLLDPGGIWMKLVTVLVALMVLPLALAVGPGAQAQAPVIGNCNVFPADHVWNTPIDTLPLDPSSSTYVNTIGTGI